MSKDVDDVLGWMRGVHDKTFESLAPQAITKAVLENLEQRDTVSIEDIIATLQERLDKYPDAARDLRLMYTAGIRLLEEIRERRPSA